MPQVRLDVDLGGRMKLPNPVMTASGCAANGRELAHFFDLGDLGAFTTKTVMGAPRSGRGTPRMAETAGGMLNSIGLQGPGIEAFVEEDLPWLASVGARVLVSIAGGDVEEFASVARTLSGSEAFDCCVGVEINISCPNVANRGLVFSCDPVSTAEVVRAVREHVPAEVPTLAKLSPDVTDMVPIAGAALAAGADGLTMINTILGMEIDLDRLRPTLGGVTGGLSGPAIHPVAVRAVFQVRAAMRAGRIAAAPVIGVGGVASGADALRLIAAGADAVQVGTAVFHDPQAPVRVVQELGCLIADKGFASVAEVVGIAHERMAT
ncbi:dihydroorotate dehydrogenase [Austwickia chelonae]|uniref:dihydroorotate dehydrogenase n=1 Tax=Austwickia chelonae TaxID=100225 RepID=UPI000E234AE8|nr:dihydroorotate dehydrogenase [Austwickia chelonae]